MDPRKNWFHSRSCVTQASWNMFITSVAIGIYSYDKCRTYFLHIRPFSFLSYITLILDTSSVFYQWNAGAFLHPLTQM